MEKVPNFEEALKATGFGKFNVALIFICGSILYTVNADAYSVGYLLPSAQCELNLTTFEKGILTSASFFGMICSSHLWGFLADTKGRKFVMITTLILSFTCTLINSFLVDFWLFSITRFLSGFFMVGASATTYAYLGEFHDDKYRAVSITSASIFVALAIIALPGIAWLIIPQTWSINIFNILLYKPWRLFLVLCALPCLLIAGILFVFPESPKFLLVQGRKHQALDVLRSVYSWNTGRKPDTFPIDDIFDAYENEEIDDDSRFDIFKSMWRQTAPLFRRPHLLDSLVASSLQFGLFAVSSGLLFWYPEIVNQLAENERMHPGKSITVCEAILSAQTKNQTTESISCVDGVDDSVFEQNLIIGAAYSIGFVFISLLVKTLGKRTLLVFFLTLSGASGIGICWITTRLIIDYLFVGLMVLSGICVGIVNAAVVDIFPTYLRAMAVCISLMFGRLGSVVASSTIGIFMEYSCTSTFILLSLLLIICAGLSFMIPNHSKTDMKNI